jgi:hypothetical protein
VIAADNFVGLDGERDVHDLLDDAQIITMHGHGYYAIARKALQGTEEPDSDEGGDPLPGIGPESRDNFVAFPIFNEFLCLERVIIIPECDFGQSEFGQRSSGVPECPRGPSSHRGTGPAGLWWAG